MESLININTIVCEEAKTTDNDTLDLKGIFSNIEISQNSDLEASSFCLVAFLTAIGEISCHLEIVLLASVGEEDKKARRIKTISINVDKGEVDNKINIFNFKSKKLISKPGQYFFNVYKFMGQDHSDLPVNEVVQKGELISVTAIEVSV